MCSLYYMYMINALSFLLGFFLSRKVHSFLWNKFILEIYCPGLYKVFDYSCNFMNIWRNFLIIRIQMLKKKCLLDHVHDLFWTPIMLCVNKIKWLYKSWMYIHVFKVGLIQKEFLLLYIDTAKILNVSHPLKAELLRIKSKLGSSLWHCYNVIVLTMYILYASSLDFNCLADLSY